MLENLIKQQVFQVSCGGAAIASPISDDGFHRMLPWQERAFAHLHASPHMILNAPMGSGKSWMMCLLSAHKLKKDSNLRCIICVPQVTIAGGFDDEKLLMPDGEKLSWKPRHNLCRSGSNEGIADCIVNWLQKRYEDLNDRVLLCTHSALVSAFKILKAEGRMELLHNLLLWVDEAHHVKNAGGETQGPGSNALGKVISYLISLEYENAQLGLTTATEFRGDRFPLLTDSIAVKFENSRFHYPWDERLASMKYLKSFSYNFLLCGPDYIKAIGSLLRLPRAKDIIHIPHPVSRHSLGKQLEVKNILGEYQEVYGKKVVHTVDGVTVLVGECGDFKILDLVDTTRRDQQKIFINSGTLKTNREALDAIVAIGMFKEGADWVHANRSIIVGTRSSLGEMIQMVGRLFRDVEGKEHVEVFHLLPFALDQNNNGFEENLNDYIKTFLASLILEDIVSPISIQMPREKETGVEHGSGTKLAAARLSELVRDAPTLMSILDEASQFLMRKESEDPALVYANYQKEFPDVLVQKHGIDKAISVMVADKVYARLLKTSLPQGIDLRDIDISIIQSTHPLEGLLRFASGACGPKTFEQLREAIKRANEKNFDEMFRLLTEYVAEHGTAAVGKIEEFKGKKLGQWVHNQRMQMRRADYSTYRKQRFESLPGFTKSHFSRNKELTFDEWCELFRSFVNRAGHANIRLRDKENGHSLGHWVVKMRSRKNELFSEEKNKLESLPGWCWVPRQESFEYGLSKLHEFVAREGLCLVPVDHEEGDFKLGIFVSRQRQAHKNGKLDEERKKQLCEVPGWTFSIRHKEWEAGLSYLQKFIERESHAIVPARHKENGFPLGRWISRLRLKYRTGKLSSDCIKTLEALPQWIWDPRQSILSSKLALLKTFADREGHSFVPQGHVEGDVDLGNFVSDLRESYIKKKLSSEVIVFLEALPGWSWDVFENQWLANFSLLQSFQSRFGHLDVPSRHKEKGFALGQWLQGQRRSFKEGTLPSHREQLLRSIGLNL